MDISVQNGNKPTAPKTVSDITTGKKLTKKFPTNKWLNIALVILLFGVAVILVCIAFLPRSTNHSEFKYVNSKAFQAVSVSTGGTSGDQIYFGNIKVLNDSYLVLNNVFYIPPSNSNSKNLTLESLVCLIDAPYNQIVVNRSSVNWWENLQSSGKVAQAITSYEKGGNASCPSTSSSSSSSSTNSSSSSTGNSTTSGTGSNSSTSGNTTP